MRKNTSIAWSIGLVFIAASCAQIIGLEDGELRPEGPIVECSTFEDCGPSATECRIPTDCVGGKCQYNFKSRGVKLTNQTTGDCKDEVCDGHGSTEFFLNDVDYDDNKPCTTDSCAGDVPQHTPRPAGDLVECYDGPPETKDVGACVAGTYECDSQGETTTECLGQVLPTTAMCDLTGVDDNCDGLMDNSEGDKCTCGDKVVSPTLNEVCDDGNLVGGDGCSPLCSPIEVGQLAVGASSTCVLLNDGRIKCWGGNSSGQLGIGSILPIGGAQGQMGAKLAVTPLPSGTKALQVGGQDTFCALLDDQTLRCWGDNSAQQLDNSMPLKNRGDNPNEMGDQLPALNLDSNLKPMGFSVGKGHVCAILTGGVLKCWGNNNAGQLGLGSTTNKPAPNFSTVSVDDNGLTVKKVSAGESHTCVILSNDRVKCWGNNSGGQLGVGDAMARGITSNDTPNKLAFIDLGPSMVTGTQAKVKQIASGRAHNCVILDDDTVKCWGYNEFGNLGLNDVNSRGDGAGEMGNMLPRVNLGTGLKAVALAAFWDNTCALLDNGAVKCWGHNGFGQLGMGNTTHIGDGVGPTIANSLPIDLGAGHKAKYVAVGFYFVCALLDDTSVKCWGQNAAQNAPDGKLGLGDLLDRGDADMEMGDKLPIVKLFSDNW